MTHCETRRAVRSFVRREGRMTRAQHRALDELWPSYGLPHDQGVLDLDAAFGRCAPRVLEIGFGMGDALAEMAAAHPEQDYLGVEVHRPGVGSLLLKLDDLGLSNVRVSCADAVQMLRDCLADDAIDAVHIFFPDPWPKKRHHKRRLVQPAFVELLRRKLKRGGRLHLATDWEDYAQHMLEVLETTAGLRNAADPGGFAPRPDYRPLTKFERRGQRLGHGVWDLIFERVG